MPAQRSAFPVETRASGERGTNTDADNAQLGLELRKGHHAEATAQGWETGYWRKAVIRSHREVWRHRVRRALPRLRPLRRDRRPSGGRPAIRAVRRPRPARDGPNSDPDDPEPGGAGRPYELTAGKAP
jgi:hypothetical protein